MDEIEHFKKIMNFIIKIPEFFYLEDYRNFQLFHSLKFNKYYDEFEYENPKKYIAITVFLEGKEKQLIKEISNLKQAFLFIKILYKENEINILIHKKEYLDYSEEILEQINKVNYFKTPIKAILKIYEFPLVNYYLKEENIEKSYINFDKVFSLEDAGKTVQNYRNFKNSKQKEGSAHSNKVKKDKNKNTKFKLGSKNKYNDDDNKAINSINNNISNNNLNNMNNNNFINNNFNNNLNSNNLGNNNLNAMNNMNMIFNLINNQNFMNNNFNIQNMGVFGMNPFQNNINSNNIIDNNSTDKENESIKSLLFTSSYKKYFPLKGLSNVGLTCYMNSTLQCLLHIPELNDYFINKYQNEAEKLKQINKKSDTKGKLSYEYYNVVKGICADLIDPKSNKEKNYNYFFSPESFNRTLSRLNPQFARFEANDSKDLLLYLFQTMHEELNYFGDQKLKSIPKCNQLIENESYEFFMLVNCNLNLSIISYLFYGILKSTTTCSSCNSILYNFQYFQFLSFPAYNYQGKIMNVYQGFKDFIKDEDMKGDNQCYCQKCKGLRDAKTKSIIFFTPPYLIINFDYGKDKKFKPSKVDFGEMIELKGFTDEKCTQKDYELIAVSSHIGISGRSGHYIAYCKDTNKNEWFEFNDSSHSKCKFSEVNSNSPYFLVYKRKDILK